MIAHTTTVVTNVLAAAAGAEERTHHNEWMVGIWTLGFLILCLIITMSFNRER